MIIHGGRALPKRHPRIPYNLPSIASVPRLVLALPTPLVRVGYSGKNNVLT